MKYAVVFHTRPHRDHKVEIKFLSGYLNTEIFVDGKLVRKLASAFELFGEEIRVPDSEDTIRVRFLRQEAKFEVFFNDQQIDNSEGSALKVAHSLSYTLWVVIGWYILALLGTFFYGGGVVKHLKPAEMLTNPTVLYFFTSTIVVLAVFIVMQARLRLGAIMLFRSAVILLILDTVYGVVYLLYISTMATNLSTEDFFLLIIPTSVKGLCAYAMVISLKKYEIYCEERNSAFLKGSDKTIDL